jgi:AmpD protein
LPYPEVDRPSPNRANTPPHLQRGVVFHHSAISYEEAIALMTRAESRVSYHCLIAPDGTRCTLVPDAEIAWHAGVSRFQGLEQCNGFMLGLSFAGNTYHAPLTGAQIASALEWLEPRWRARGWSLAWMTDHRQVAPGRKDDLNPVEWERLRAALAARFG